MRRQASLRDNNALTAPTEGAEGRRREAGGVTTFGNDAVQPILVPGGQSSLQLEFSALHPVRKKEREMASGTGREREIECVLCIGGQQQQQQQIARLLIKRIIRAGDSENAPGKGFCTWFFGLFWCSAFLRCLPRRRRRRRRCVVVVVSFVSFAHSLSLAPTLFLWPACLLLF